MVKPRSSQEKLGSSTFSPFTDRGPDESFSNPPLLSLQTSPVPDSHEKSRCDDSGPSTLESGDDSSFSLNTASHHHGLADVAASPRTPILQIRTDVPALHQPCQQETHSEHEPQILHSRSTASLPRRSPSIRTILAAAAATHSSAGSLSPGSAFSSPQLAALNDITPLPSPIQLSSPPWQTGSSTFSLSRASSTASHRESLFTRRGSDNGNVSRSSSIAHYRPTANFEKPQPVQEGSQSVTVPEPSHTRNRSLSDYVPATPNIPQSRKATFHGPTQHPTRNLTLSETGGFEPNLQREEYLGIQRGITSSNRTLPKPPPARTQRISSHNDSASRPVLLSPQGDSVQTYHVRSVRTKQPRKYRRLRQLGQGTFSQVVLAVREWDEQMDTNDQVIKESTPPRLVAVKIVEYGPAGGADEERVEVSLNREVEILKSINHPSVVQLKAFGSNQKRALLVLDYCPGGDLFEFASQGVKPVPPSLIRRIFSELVEAVRYLHRNQIVHRDIKLENVLVNMPAPMISGISDWCHYPRAVVTLTDLGLSRRIPQPPESPLLHTRCGSEDYAAPEILMGQPYDGRSTDAWALAVLLYAIMENRLPFDVLPGTRGDPIKLRARTPHRIARCEWSWCRYADEDGEWDSSKGRDLEDARICVEGLLRRSSKRMDLDEIAKMEWVQDAIDVPAGLRRGDIEVP